MAEIKNIIIHCSDSLWGCAREIKLWHTAPPPQGRGWSDIGYHFVIQNGRPTPRQLIESLDGAIECGRYIDEDNIIGPKEVGIHTMGYNSNSIGICLVGMNEFTIPQFDSLKRLLIDLCVEHGIKPDNILGHCETESGKAQGKTCPNFDVQPFRSWLKQRLFGVPPVRP